MGWKREGCSRAGGKASQGWTRELGGSGVACGPTPGLGGGELLGAPLGLSAVDPRASLEMCSTLCLPFGVPQVLLAPLGVPHPCPYSSLCPPPPPDLHFGPPLCLEGHLQMPHISPNLTLPQKGLRQQLLSPLHRDGDVAVVAGHAGQAVPKQPWAGNACAHCTLCPSHSPTKPATTTTPTHLGSGRCSPGSHPWCPGLCRVGGRWWFFCSETRHPASAHELILLAQ